MVAYFLLVGVPVLGLLGILEAGRGIAAPLSIGGEWHVECGAAAQCANVPTSLSIVQSGTEAEITLHNGQATTFEATINGANLTAKTLSATISGNPGERILVGKMDSGGGAPIAFRAVRQAAKKRGE